jgi:lipopolysaccharide transport system permease protein
MRVWMEKSQVRDLAPAIASVHARPARPLLTIRPRPAIASLHLREAWAHRELLLFLAWRDLKVRYKQTALGAAWAVVQPLLPMAIFAATLGRVIGPASGTAPYALFVYAALLPWTFFANAVTSSTNSIIGNANLISKVYFPRLIIPAAAVLGASVDFAIAFAMLGGLLAWYRIPLHPHMLMTPVLALLVVVLALGAGLLFSALSVKYRDVRHALPFAVQLWMFATPVVFPVTMMPPSWRWLLALNPMTGIVEAFRSAVLGLPFQFMPLAISAGFSVTLLICAAWFFRRAERTFADTI